MLLSGSELDNNSSSRKTTIRNGTNDVSIQIVPNPVNNYLRIKGIDDDTSIQIFDMQGKLLLKNSGRMTDVSSLAPGIYLVQFGDTVSRFVK